MKKICFVIVLSIVSVLSIFAQTSSVKSAENVVQIEKAKVETDTQETVIDPNTVDETSETVIPAEEKKPEIKAEEKPLVAVKVEEKKPEIKVEEKKPEATEQVIKTEVKEAVKKPEESILQVKKVSLGGLSTGNATIDAYIEEFSELYNVDPRLIYAQMSQESSFKARATSHKGASGYMQLMPATARRFGVTNIYNPKQNIHAGVKYMRWLLDKFGGDVALALAGYNAGEGSVLKYGNKIPPFRETRQYVAKIMAHYDQISNQDSTLAGNEVSLIK